MMLLLIGFLSGIIGGMGIGGGTILIPFLIFFSSLTQQQAQGINLFVFIPTAIVALTTHIKDKNINFKIAIPLIISGIIGAFFGSYLAVNISSEKLKNFFALFLFLMGSYEIFSKVKK
ncbi:MAG: sulfite exporter TauE/SafE family protein [Firmicutes bacterium]|nr:sulfite exporter TauE/SafE family protein [Bacillota bacterium]